MLQQKERFVTNEVVDKLTRGWNGADRGEQVPSARAALAVVAVVPMPAYQPTSLPAQRRTSSFKRSSRAVGLEGHRGGERITRSAKLKSQRLGSLGTPQESPRVLKSLIVLGALSGLV